MKISPRFVSTAVLVLLGGTSARAQAPSLGVDAATPVLVEVADDDEEDQDFIHTVNEYYSIILDEDLEPEVDDQLIPLYVTSVFCGPFCGALWIPMLWVGEDPGADYFAREALFLILKEWLTSLIGGATSSFGIGAIIVAANTFYLTPIGIINAYDRALKTNRARGANAEKKRTPKAKRSKRNAAQEARDRPHAPAMAMRY